MARKDKPEQSVVCLIKGCTDPAHSRGLCHKHYKAATIEINEGRTTWDELVELALAAPKKKPGRKSDFLEKIQRAKAKALPRQQQLGRKKLVTK